MSMSMSGFEMQGLVYPSATGGGCIPPPPTANGKDESSKPTGKKRAALKPQGEGVVSQQKKAKCAPNGLSAKLRAFVEAAKVEEVAAAHARALLHKGPVVVLFAPIADACLACAHCW